jgi:hypothetical protein
LKHRFIRNAGPTEGLQELIERREEWEARRGDRLSKTEMYETIRTVVGNEDDDPWIFATIRPGSASSATTVSDGERAPEKAPATVKRIPSPLSVRHILILLIIATSKNRSQYYRG